MSRYPHPYAQHCDANCGCCEPLDLEESGSISLPEIGENDSQKSPE